MAIEGLLDLQCGCEVALDWFTHELLSWSPCALHYDADESEIEDMVKGKVTEAH